MVTLNVVRTITIKSTTDGVDQTTTQLKNLKTAHDNVGTSAQKTATVTDMASKSQLSLADAAKRANDQLNASVKSQQNFQAANDNVAKSYVNLEEAKGEFDKGLVDTIAGTLNLINHFKLLALAAYGAVPAFRAAVNTGLKFFGAEIAIVSPAILAFGQKVLPYLKNALSFFSSIALPIGLAIAAFTALNYVWKTGADLLEKYDGFYRKVADQIAGTNTAQNIAKLTPFQQFDSGTDTPTAAQAARAQQLAAQLAQAKQDLKESLAILIDVNDLGLKFQELWIRIIQIITKGVDAINSIIDKFGGFVSSALAFAQRAANVTNPRYAGPTGTDLGGAQQDAQVQDYLAAQQAMQRARGNLAVGLTARSGIGTTGFAGRYADELKSLAGAAPKEPTAAGPSGYDTFVDKIQTEIKTLEEEAAGANKTSAAIEELKVTHEGLAAATKAGIKPTDEMRAQWKAWGDQIAALNIQLRQTKALQEEQFKGATMFMSPADQAAAAIAHQIDPTNWQAHIHDAAAELAKFNSIMGQTRDAAVGFADTFEQGILQGKTAIESLQAALKNLESQLLSMLNKQLINSLFGALAPSFAPGGGTGGIGHAALGNVYSNGRVIPFASGGIVTMPTLFPMAGGAGLMGEAGPEAVMPLTRGADGKLGVAGGGTNVNVVVNNSHSGVAVDVQQRKNPKGDIDIVASVRRIVDDHVASGGIDGPMRARYGSQIRARAR